MLVMDIVFLLHLQVCSKLNDTNFVFIPPFPCDHLLLYREKESIHKLDPPEAAAPLIFPLHIFITLTRKTLKYTATFQKSSALSI